MRAAGMTSLSCHKSLQALAKIVASYFLRRTAGDQNGIRYVSFPPMRSRVSTASSLLMPAQPLDTAWFELAGLREALTSDRFFGIGKELLSEALIHS
jgi:hypothetical protein